MSIVMGAVGAHAAADPYVASLIDKASHYQLVHALLLLYLSPQQGVTLHAARWLALAGTVFFCGSLYLKALQWLPEAGRLAPMGGTAFMLAWLCVAAASLKGTKHD